MGYFQVRYDSRVVNYDRGGFIRLATGWLEIGSHGIGRSQSWYFIANLEMKKNDKKIFFAI